MLTNTELVNFDTNRVCWVCSQIHWSDWLLAFRFVSKHKARMHTCIV